MTRTLIGKGTTNAQGIATMTEDAQGQSINGYTGVGAGLIDVEAEVTIDGSSVVSIPYPVCDCLYYDDCTSANHNTNWFNRNNLSTDYTGDVLKLTAGTNGGNYMPDRTGTHTSIADVTEWTPSFAVEYDIITFDDGTKHNVGISSVGRSYTQLGLSNSSEHHIKIVYNGSKVYYYIDGSNTATYSADLTTNPVYISIGVSSGATQTIKDVKIYPI